MKKTQSTQQTKAKQNVAKLLPEPLELAKLAAILGPELQPRAALEKAMIFYIEAVLFLDELPASFEEQQRLALPFNEAVKPIFHKAWEDVLELDQKNDDSPACIFLREHGLKLKTARAALENIQRHCRSGILVEYKVEKDNKSVYRIPRYLLEKIAPRAKRARAESKRKGHKTRQRKSSV